MATWNTKRTVKKTQSFEFTGEIAGGGMEIASLFNGTSVTNAQVFTLNRGFVFGSRSCDYETVWTFNGTKLNPTSYATTWSATPTELITDYENGRNYPLYYMGYFHTITIPSGYCFYTIELNGTGTFTLYENEVPTEIQMGSGIATGKKVYRTYYNQTANSCVLRCAGTGINFATISSAYYFVKNRHAVANTAIVTESIYGSASLNGGITVEGSVSGGGGGGEGGSANMPTNEIIPKFGFNGLILENMTAYQLGVEVTYSPASMGYLYTFFDFTNIDNNYLLFTYATLRKISGAGNCTIKQTNLKHLYLGGVGSPVTTPFQLILVNGVMLNIYVYTVGGADIGITINNPYGRMYQITYLPA